MKDVLKVMGTYFAVGFGTLVGVGAGMKVCDKLLDTKSKKQKEDEEINKMVEEAKAIVEEAKAKVNKESE